MNRRPFNLRPFLIVAVSVLLRAGIAFCSGSPAANIPGPAANLAFETSPLMRDLSHYDRKAPPADWQNLSGALGLNLRWETNKTLPWFIEYQKDGRDWIASGLAHGNKDGVRWGLKILEWGFAQMTPEGEFKHPDNYHSASFLVEATAHSILLLEASPWRAEFAGPVNALKPKLLAAARWMIRPEIDALNWPDDNNYPRIFGERRYAHRRFLDAAALGEVAVLFNDRPLMEKSVWLVRNGIALQQPDGVNPERGGHDTSYQALGLLYACRYYQLVADEAMRAEMKPGLDRGFGWLLTRIQPDGRIDGTGNTRTGPAGEMGRSGKPKGLDHRTTAICLAYGAQLSLSPELEKTARRVFAFGQNPVPDKK